MFVKCHLDGDVRRFSVEEDDDLSLASLKGNIAFLYHLPNDSFTLVHVEEASASPISNEKELQDALVLASKINVLRLVVRMNDSQNNLSISSLNLSDSLPNFSSPTKPILATMATSTTGTNTTNSISQCRDVGTGASLHKSEDTSTQATTPTSDISTNTPAPFSDPEENVDFDRVWANPRFQEKLGRVVAHALVSQAFQDLVKDMAPRVLGILNDSKRSLDREGAFRDIANPQSFPKVERTETNPFRSNYRDPQIEDSDPYEPINVPLLPVFPSVSDISSIASITPSGSETAPIEPSLSEMSAISTISSISSLTSSPSATGEQNSEIAEQKPEIDDDLDEKRATEAAEEHSKTTPEEEVKEESKEDNESFTVVKDEQQTTAPSTSPLVGSLLNFLKSFDGRSKQKTDEEPVIPNLEDLLNQLASMGFTDREQNIKALKFHKKYNEGLNEVIEDLLSMQNK
eukprot:TRINITY_DN1607_c0_g1_i2.p1 TRINITY_DN1607_c0_g1~~TRINITY_DN1607_c0_g1_i2.p1  ORF type:complete len:460 (+),score=128.53 TRINITY_DN1607_c0_g1_i2:114-1493(+)